MNKDDLLEIGKFLTNFFKDRKDILNVYVEEGTENMSPTECTKFIGEMFEGREHFTKIINKDEYRGQDKEK